jgi:hypothetical protein
MLRGKNVMSWQVLFASKNTKGNWGWYGLYGTLPEAFLVSGNYRIRRKQIFVSYDSMETNFRFLLGNEFSFLGNEFSFPPETNFCFQETKLRFRGTVPLGPVPLQDYFMYLQATGWHHCWCTTLQILTLQVTQNPTICAK